MNATLGLIVMCVLSAIAGAAISFLIACCFAAGKTKGDDDEE